MNISTDGFQSRTFIPSDMEQVQYRDECREIRNSEIWSLSIAGCETGGLAAGGR